jgi:hypothetical protein
MMDGGVMSENKTSLIKTGLVPSNFSQNSAGIFEDCLEYISKNIAGVQFETGSNIVRELRFQADLNTCSERIKLHLR